MLSVVEGFDTEAAKKRFLKMYLLKYKKTGHKVAVAFSASGRNKVDANFAAAGLPITMLDAIVSADAFRTLKPAPDIFLAASWILDVPTSEASRRCIVTKRGGDAGS